MKTTLSPRIAVMCTASWLHRPETYFHFQHLLFRRPIFQPRAFRFDRNPPSHLILSHIDACIDDKRKEKGSSTQTRKGAYRSIERVLSTRDKGKRRGRWSKQRNENSEREGAGSNGFEYPARIHLLPLSSRVTRYVAALVGPALVLKFSVTGEP